MVHDLRHALVIFRKVQRSLRVFLREGGEFVAADVRHAEEIGVAHAVFDGGLPRIFFVPDARPARHVLHVDEFGVIDVSHRSPHICRGITRPAVALEQVCDVGGYILRVCAVLQKIVGERLHHILLDHLHDHVVGRAYQVVAACIDLQLVVHVFVRPEGGILHADAVFFFELRDQVDIIVLDGAVVVHRRLTDVIFPVIHAQHGRIRSRAC